jgi:hypothetical protein
MKLRKFSGGVAALFILSLLLCATYVLAQSANPAAANQTKQISPPSAQNNQAGPIPAKTPVIPKPATPPTTGPKLIVYYFHSSYRCHSCITIEKFTKAALDEGFPAELQSGTVNWKPLNLEDSGNEHFSTDYKLYTKSVVLSLWQNGQEKSWKNLEEVWTLLRDEIAFKEYIQKEIKIMLAGKSR